MPRLHVQQLTKFVPITRYQFALTARALFHRFQSRKTKTLFAMICLAVGLLFRGKNRGVLVLHSLDL